MSAVGMSMAGLLCCFTSHMQHIHRQGWILHSSPRAGCKPRQYKASQRMGLIVRIVRVCGLKERRKFKLNASKFTDASRLPLSFVFCILALRRYPLSAHPLMFVIPHRWPTNHAHTHMKTAPALPFLTLHLII